jgi:hypothetical protein
VKPGRAAVAAASTSGGTSASGTGVLPDVATAFAAPFSAGAAAPASFPRPDSPEQPASAQAPAINRNFLIFAPPSRVPSHCRIVYDTGFPYKDGKAG